LAERNHLLAMELLVLLEKDRLKPINASL